MLSGLGGDQDQSVGDEETGVSNKEQIIRRISKDIPEKSKDSGVVNLDERNPYLIAM